MLKTGLKALFILAMSIATFWTFWAPDAANFQNPPLARMFFWHFPCPMMLLVFMFAGIYFAFRVFRKLNLKPVENSLERLEWDARTESAMELGFIWACLTMLTGIIFSWVQWGVWWQWDPRQSSFLLALLIYAAYFAMRNSFGDPDKRAQFTAAYALASATPIFFLVLIFPYLPQVMKNSFHPTGTIIDGQLHGTYKWLTYVMLALMTVLSAHIYRMRAAVAVAAVRLEYKDGTFDSSSSIGATPTGVVRPVGLSSKDGPAT